MRVSEKKNLKLFYHMIDFSNLVIDAVIDEILLIIKLIFNICTFLYYILYYKYMKFCFI